MKRFAVIATVSLVVVSGASAKGPPSGFRICGVNACVAVTGNDAERLAITMFYGGGAALTSAPKAATFFAMHWRWNDTAPEQTGYYVPEDDAIHLAGSTQSPVVPRGWFALNETAQATLARITSSLDAFPSASTVRATVNAKVVREPASYAALWTIGKPVYDWPASGWSRVRIYTDAPSPWQGSVLISRRGNLLLRENTVFAVPARTAARVRAALPLR